MPSATSSAPSSVWQGLNRTELYQLCRRAGMNVHPLTDPRYLAAYLDGEVEPPPCDETSHPIDRCRHAIIGFLDEYWARVHPQLKCPARNLNNPDETKRDRRPCFGCTDLQVVACIEQNGKNESLIRLYLPKKQP